MFEAGGEDGRAHRLGAVTGTVVGIDALDLDAVAGKESEGGVEEGDGTGGRFVFHNSTFPSPRRMNNLLERHTPGVPPRVLLIR